MKFSMLSSYRSKDTTRLEESQAYSARQGK